MKFIYQLTALAASFALVNAAPTPRGLDDRIQIQFCTDSSLSTCDTPVSIYQLGDFSIPEDYTYVASVPTPSAPFYTITKAVNGKTVACYNGFTGAKAPLTKSVQDTKADGATYTVVPVRLTKVDGVKCSS